MLLSYRKAGGTRDIALVLGNNSNKRDLQKMRPLTRMYVIMIRNMNHAPSRAMVWRSLSNYEISHKIS